MKDKHKIETERDERVREIKEGSGDEQGIKKFKKKYVRKKRKEMGERRRIENP